jgi:hypothetical protein
MIEQQHRWRRNAALAGRRILLGCALPLGERGRPVHQPDAVMAVDRDAGDLAQDPVVRQRLRPERIDLELRYGVVGKSRRGRQNCNRKHRNGFHRPPPAWTGSMITPNHLARNKARRWHVARVA